MIQVKELRIGNHVTYVTDEDIRTHDVITGIMQDCVLLAGSEGKKQPLNNVEPVALTREVLKSSGFQFTNDDWYECAIKYGKLNFNLKYEVCSISDNDYTNECILTEYNSVKYLHQLENIYFSLTGKELEIIL